MESKTNMCGGECTGFFFSLCSLKIKETLSLLSVVILIIFLLDKNYVARLKTSFRTV